MDEFGRMSLLRLAASIGSDDHWVMAASCAAITLTPLRMMSSEERQSAMDRSVLLRLTDLGYVEGTAEGGAEPPATPLSNSIGVLLLPWSLQAAVARLAQLARTSPVSIPGCYAPEDWLITGHIFVDDAQWGPQKGIDGLGAAANTVFGMPPAGRRHFIFGQSAGELRTLDSWVGTSSHPDGTARGDHIIDESSVVDPLAYTNPGSVPEGLSPLFVHHSA